ncbi:MAG: hypothetical protein ACLTS6_05615 [Anaerobutyricum sp.]
MYRRGVGCIFIGVHNAELTQQTANLMDKYNQIADKIAENGYIANLVYRKLC